MCDGDAGKWSDSAFPGNYGESIRKRLRKLRGKNVEMAPRVNCVHPNCGERCDLSTAHQILMLEVKHFEQFIIPLSQRSNTPGAFDKGSNIPNTVV